MTNVYALEQIKKTLPTVDLISAMERAFSSYSAGLAVVPPVGELLFDDPPGDVHIKYGYIRGDDVFVVKVSSGFYRNPELGLESNSGLMIIFNARTGYPKAVLLDEGHLTAERTAAAGAVAAKHLAPARVNRIGICGTGLQARLQLAHLERVTSCRSVAVWGRSRGKAEAYARNMSSLGFDVEVMGCPEDIAASCNLIVTATVSEIPLLAAADIRPGTHITAIGADAPHKQELCATVLEASDLVIVDSRSQARERGELYHAVKAGVALPRVVELGEIVSRSVPGRQSETEITVADLTGVAVQDIEICKAVLASI